MFDFRSLFSVVLVLSSVCYLSAPKASTFEAATEQVKAKLIASVDAVHAGDEILVGVNQRIIPHWHTYWINPGDSGLATTINYKLPTGATAGDIQWPTPERIMLGPVTNYGYANEVTLLSSIKIPSDSVVGSVFSINAAVKWLVCEEICIPQKVDLVLDLPVVSPSVSIGQGSPLIAAAQASLPVASPWAISLEHGEKTLSLRINDSALNSKAIEKIWFYPSEWGKVVHNAEQPWQVSTDGIELKLSSGEAPLSVGQNLSGVLAITENSSGTSVTRGYIVNVAGQAAGASTGESDVVLSTAMLLALLGGVILNLMPCVFPVLSIKALALIKHAQQHPKETRLHGLAYTLGILLSFALLGGVLIALKAGGAQIGWGFQFQSPLFVLAVAYLMFAVGLSLSGVFSIGSSIAGVGSSLAGRSGYSGSFFTGVLATVVATPCTAPFMGAAIGFALTQPAVSLLAVFFSLGLGLAFPFLLLSNYPALQRKLPKPGVWMDRLKQGLAFPMYGAAVWLVWVLAQQAGVNSVAIALGGMVVIAFAAWLYEFSKYSGKIVQRSGLGIASLSLAFALAGGYFGIETVPAAPSSTTESAKNYEAYTPERLSALRHQGKPVFVNLTAAWCISCLVNEKVALSQHSVIDAFKQSGITYLKGDWTNRDAEITKLLAEFGRSGVPLYVFYPAGNASQSIVLPQILTPEIVTKAVGASLVNAAL
jgi:thiol:disulfide interchange protein DsbD